MRAGVAILADDLTGAADSGAPFAVEGFATTVSLGLPRAAAYIHAIDLGCRDRWEEAWDRTASVAASEASRAIFLKIDSTLRGPISDMVDAACRASGRPCAVVAPAFPEQGRALIGGRLAIDGYVDPAAPSLVDALTPRCRRVTLVGRKGDAGGTANRILEIARRAKVTTAVVVDDDDGSGLAAAAAAWVVDPSRLVLVGSSGVARRAARGLSGPRHERGPVIATRARTAVSVAVVGGSPALQSQRQLDQLERRPLTDLRTRIFRSPPLDSPSSRDAAVSSTGAVDRFAQWLDEGNRPALVVLVGGCTARLALERLHATGIDVGGEVAPGVAYGRLLGGALAGTLVVTKAGAFGDDDLLRVVIRTASDPTRLLWNVGKEVP